jgi:hypothetical protein
MPDMLVILDLTAYLLLPVKMSSLDPFLSAWLEGTSSIFDRILKMLTQQHADRLSRLQALSEAASNQLWWPFTQHSSLADGSVEVIKLIIESCHTQMRAFRADIVLSKMLILSLPCAGDR